MKRKRETKQYWAQIRADSYNIVTYEPNPFEPGKSAGPFTFTRAKSELRRWIRNEQKHLEWKLDYYTTLTEEEFNLYD